MALIDSRFFRYLLSGGLNTALTYLIYLGLMAVIGTIPAYAVAYLGGLAFSYLANRGFVFRYRGTHRQVALKYAATHLAILGLSALLLNVLVGLGVNRAFAPLIVIALSVPGSFLAFRLLFGKAREESA